MKITQSFRMFSLIWNMICCHKRKDMVASLIDKVKKEPSHIGIKVHQTLHFLERLIHIDAAEQKEMDDNGFSYDEYMQHFFPDKTIEGPKAIMEYYPPSIFRNYILSEERQRSGMHRISNCLVQVKDNTFLPYLLTFTICEILFLFLKNADRVKYNNVCLFFGRDRTLLPS